MSMSMSVRQKQLTKTVMCSLLAAGVINVCIDVYKRQVITVLKLKLWDLLPVAVL